MKSALVVLCILLVPAGIASARDVSEQGILTGGMRLGLTGNSKFGYTIGHELPQEHKVRMKQLESAVGWGLQLSYRRGITPSVLFGVSAEYFRSGTMKQKDDFGNVVEVTASKTDSTTLGSYALYGVGASLYPGLGITERLMLFAEVGIGGYTARVAGKTQELNAALNAGVALHYFATESLGIELCARMPLFLAEFVFMEQGYTLDPSPLQVSLGVSWLR